MRSDGSQRLLSRKFIQNSTVWPLDDSLIYLNLAGNVCGRHWEHKKLINLLLILVVLYRKRVGNQDKIQAQIF